MATTIFAALAFVLIASNAVILGQCASASKATATAEPKPVMASNSTANSANVSALSDTEKKADEANYADIMKKCNESNTVSMEYLTELNSTGSFPDESDKGPMCYIKCYLQGVGILNEDGSVNSARANSMLWPNSLDAIDDCLKEQDGLFEKDANGSCENAYYLTRCVMIKELLATRNAAT